MISIHQDVCLTRKSKSSDRANSLSRLTIGSFISPLETKPWTISGKGWENSLPSLFALSAS